MIARLLGAIQFLTVIPVPGSTALPGQSALFFPLVGAVLGFAGAGVLLVVSRLASASVAAILTVAFWAWITGGLHEDGLADVFDAFRAGRSPDRIHSILKDSRIGAHGALALILVVLLRCSSISGLTPVALATALGISRTTMVTLAWISPPTGDGLGRLFSTSMTTPVAIAAMFQAILLASLNGPVTALLLIAVSAAITYVASRYFKRRIYGITGDCLGATCLLTETALLILLSCRSFTS